MAYDHYKPPNAPNQDGQPIRSNWALRVLIFVVVAITMSIAFFVARETWRARMLLAFCKAAQPGITFTDFLALEKRHSIDDSYVVQAQFDGYVDQASSHDLELRSHMYDPDFACAITHDGQRVKNVQLLMLEGFDPN